MIESYVLQVCPYFSSLSTSAHEANLLELLPKIIYSQVGYYLWYKHLSYLSEEINFLEVITKNNLQ